MAYCIPMRRLCEAFGCKKKATTEVYSEADVLHGVFCPKHALIRKNRLEVVEKGLRDAV